MSAPRVAAVILAGGKGERLGGVVKANIVIGGVRLLDRVTEAIGGSASPILVAHGAIDPALMALGAQHVPIPDLASDYGGPLAGVAAGVAWCRDQRLPPDYLASLAVDTPFFPADFVSRALAAIGPEAPAVVARYEAQEYPTNALWRLSSLETLPDRVMEGAAPHSLRRLAIELGAIYLDWPPGHSGDPFANANTPDDLLSLRARAEQSPQS
jgi:molybdopterin-guanine dinucleotide biosynthesis protein A